VQPRAVNLALLLLARPQSVQAAMVAEPLLVPVLLPLAQ